MEKKTVDDYLNSVSYDFTGYTPSEASLNFVNFIKLVNGGNPESNKTPPVHYQLMDNVFSKKSRLAILCHRGFAKSTLLTGYLPYYIAVFGKLDNFGVVNYILAVLDSQEGGAKTMRRTMEQMYNNSDFLRKYITYTRFTDDFIELENLDGHRLGIKLTGAQMAIRGTRFSNKSGSHRPELALMDDILKDSDAKSPTVIEAIEHTIHRAVDKALHPTRNKVIYIGTVFSAKDPLYKVIESGRWSPSVYPVCEEFPCSKEDFRGSWEDRFPYHTVKRMYDDAIAMGRPGDFNVEMMNRVMSDEDRAILDSDIMWYKRENVLKNKGLFNFYITTDFATSEKNSADYSVISVWAYNNNGDWMWVDGVCKRQLMDENVNSLFRLAQEYKPQSVGIEVSGQQGGFVPWIMNEMVSRNIYFPLGSDNNTGKPGIRPVTNKMQRFNVILPMFKAKKIFFPLEMKEEPIMREMYNELSLITPTEFKSKHDDFCFPGHTPIITKVGVKPIEKVTIEDYVLTRAGWKRVLRAWCSGNKEVITRFGITATPNHLVFTENRGWVSLDTLDMYDTINYVQHIGEVPCESYSSLMEEVIIDTQMQNSRAIEDTTPHIANGNPPLDFYTETSGNTIMEKYQKDITCITQMGILTTTPLKTLYAYQLKLTEQNIEKKQVVEVNQKNNWNIYREYGKKLKNGTGQRKEESGIDKMHSRLYKKTSQKENVLAAVSSLNQLLPETVSVPLSAEDYGQTTCLGNQCAEKEKVPVYDLTVEDSHEFFAWGALVHNCDTISMLSLMKPFKPSQETPKPSAEVDRFWDDMDEDNDNTRINSYVV